MYIDNKKEIEILCKNINMVVEFLKNKIMPQLTCHKIYIPYKSCKELLKETYGRNTENEDFNKYVLVLNEKEAYIIKNNNCSSDSVICNLLKPVITVNTDSITSLLYYWDNDINFQLSTLLNTHKTFKEKIFKEPFVGDIDLPF